MNRIHTKNPDITHLENFINPRCAVVVMVNTSSRRRNNGTSIRSSPGSRSTVERHIGNQQEHNIYSAQLIHDKKGYRDAVVCANDHVLPLRELQRVEPF